MQRLTGAVRWFGDVAVTATLLTALAMPFLYGADAGFFLGTAQGPIRRPTNHLRGMFEADADGITRARPYWRGHHAIDGRSIQVTMNNLGMRGRDIGPKAPVERRVLVTGDSFVWGYGVADTEAFPSLLERELTEQTGTTITVGNAGMPGYGVRKQIDTVRYLKTTFAPDVVVGCVFVGNDFEDDATVEEDLIDGHVVRGPMARWVRGSWRAQLALRFQLAFLVEQCIDHYLPQLSSDRTLLALPTQAELDAARFLPPPHQRGGGLFLDARDVDARLTGLFAEFARTIAELRDAAAPIPLVVVVIPSSLQISPAQYANTLHSMGFDPTGFERGAAAARLTRECTDSGIQAVDLFPLLDRGPGQAQNWLQVAQHLSPQGHRLVAARLAPVIQALLPPR